MRHRLGIVILAAATTAGGCTVSQDDPPALTGPSGLAQAISISANPDSIAMGQSATTPGQPSLVIASVLDANGQPKPNQTVRFDTVVNGQPSDCGQLSTATAITGSDGQVSTLFIAPGNPPDCPNFNTDGSVTVRVTPVGTDFRGSSLTARSVSIFMALPSANPAAASTVNFTMIPITGTRNYQFNGTSSASPGHTIMTYAWTFSDGHAESGPIVSHDFAAAGTYVITLTVTDEIGQSWFKSALLPVS